MLLQQFMSLTHLCHTLISAVFVSQLCPVVYVLKAASPKPNKGGPIEENITFFPAGGAWAFLVTYYTSHMFHPSIHYLYTLYVCRLILCRVAGTSHMFLNIKPHVPAHIFTNILKNTHIRKASNTLELPLPQKQWQRKASWTKRRHIEFFLIYFVQLM